jgi:hypothetical protein
VRIGAKGTHTTPHTHRMCQSHLVTARGTNIKLATLLTEAGWSRAETARRVREHATQTGHPSIAADASRVTRWIAGERPRPPTGNILATVLGDHVGRRLTLTDLGLTPPVEDPTPLPADHGMDVPWTAAGLLQHLEDWPTPMLNRRQFLAVSGAALTTPAWQSLETAAPLLTAAVEAERAPVTRPVLNVIDDLVS